MMMIFFVLYDLYTSKNRVGRGSQVVGRGSWVVGSKSWVVAGEFQVVGRGLLIGRDLH